MKDYVKKAIQTECGYSKALGRLTIAESVSHGKDLIRLLHGSMTLTTESGELADAIKKSVFYGKELDLVNLAEEVGDVLWAVAIICDELGVSIEEVMEANIYKLRKRYPDKFKEGDALNRDLTSERASLEQNFNAKLL